MSTCVSKSLPIEPKGIGMILGSECKRSYNAAAPLRRTLSADMSSTKWLSQNGVYTTLKKIASSKEFPIDKIEDEENRRSEDGKQEHSNIWSTIVEKGPLLPAQALYVHPLVKQSKTLSQNSLEVCTESLGSETGSDGFSSYAPSDASDSEQEDEELLEKISYDTVERIEAGYATRKFPPRSFPPPLPSLSHMKHHRKDGRLVLEAVPLPVSSKNYFHAQREGGRLLLTFVKPMEEIREEIKINNEENELELNDQEMIEDIEEDEEVYNEEIEEETEEVMVETGIVLGMTGRQPSPPRIPTGVINVHRSALMVNKLIGLTNKNPTWSSKLLAEVEDEDPTQFLQSLPTNGLIGRHLAAQPTTTMTTSSSLNTYEYCWRTKTSSTATVGLKQPQLLPIRKSYNKNNFTVSKNQKPHDQQHLVVLRGDTGDFLVPVVNGCKEPRRTLLFWEPYCIATS